eukprot:14738661-Alexandrium_andersonii.AAC.1
MLQRCGRGVAKVWQSGHRCGREKAYIIDVWRPPQGIDAGQGSGAPAQLRACAGAGVGTREDVETCLK